MYVLCLLHEDTLPVFVYIKAQDFDDAKKVAREIIEKWVESYREVFGREKRPKVYLLREKV